MKTFSKSILLALSLATTIFSSSCKKEDNSTTAIPNSETVKVQFRFIASPGTEITTVVYYEGTSTVNNTTSGKGNTWTSPEVSVPRTHATATASANSDSETATMKAQILQNGQVIKESGESTGKFLNASISLL